MNIIFESDDQTGLALELEDLGFPSDAEIRPAGPAAAFAWTQKSVLGVVDAAAGLDKDETPTLVYDENALQEALTAWAKEEVAAGRAGGTDELVEEVMDIRDDFDQGAGFVLIDVRPGVLGEKFDLEEWLTEKLLIDLEGTRVVTIGSGEGMETLDSAIVGCVCGGRIEGPALVYDYELLVEAYASLFAEWEKLDLTDAEMDDKAREEARDWVDANTAKSLQYGTERGYPVLMRRIERYEEGLE